MFELVKKFLNLPSSEKALVARSAGMLIFVKAGLAVTPFEPFCRFIGNRPATAGARRNNRPPVEKIGWAMAAASRAIPRGGRCLPRALAAEWMLRRFGYEPNFKIGVASGEAGNFEAHAWLECEGRPVIGGFELGRYTELLVRGPGHAGQG